MGLESGRAVIEWLDGTLPKVSEAEIGQLKDFLVEFLEEHPVDEEREEFIEALCTLVEGIIENPESFAREFHEVVVSQHRMDDVENWITVYDLPSHLCRQKLIIREFEQFGEIVASKVCGSVTQDRRNALIKFVDKASVEACLKSTVPFFNDRFVQVCAVEREEPLEHQTGTAIGQLSTQLGVKSKQLAGYRERLREIQQRIEATNPKDACNLKHCYLLYQDFLEELERKQLTPALLYRLRDRLRALKEDPKMYVKPKALLANKRLKT